MTSGEGVFLAHGLGSCPWVGRPGSYAQSLAPQGVSLKLGITLEPRLQLGSPLGEPLAGPRGERRGERHGREW